MMHINTIDGRVRMSTQELLQTISEAVEKGETNFQIKASGQHDIGGPLWNKDGKEIKIVVTNPGQRVGSMCLPNTKIVVECSAPADVAWLNAGGIVTVHGDAGDTAAHCAAAGKVFIGGRAGTRSGSLMKHDPNNDPPQLWVLKTTGSFSFEFMGGGIAVVCGYDSQTLPSVLGERPCVGMVGGTIYFRGSVSQLPQDVRLQTLDENDIAWLDKGMDEFLENISMPKLKFELSIWNHWHKIVPVIEKKSKTLLSMEEFHRDQWLVGGIFSDIYYDDFKVIPLTAKGEHRLYRPVWQNITNSCSDCRKCLLSCPQNAIKRREDKTRKEITYSCNDARCIGCGICSTVCPNELWHMENNNL